MIHSSRRDRTTKAIAEVLAMIADAHPELPPRYPRPDCETDEWLWQSATEFCAAFDRYAGLARQTKKEEITPEAGRSKRRASLVFKARPEIIMSSQHGSPP
ncbi:MAG: hypothetical protein ACREDT_06825 [Methylocella sp.]